MISGHFKPISVPTSAERRPPTYSQMTKLQGDKPPRLSASPALLAPEPPGFNMNSNALVASREPQYGQVLGRLAGNLGTPASLSDLGTVSKADFSLFQG